MHGSFSRADTYNFMAAIGPDFKSHLVDPVPVSNADVGATIGAIMGFTLSGKGTLTGRVMSEALVGGTTPSFTRSQLTSAKASNGIVTTLKRQAVEGTIYLDQAGFPGRTVGIH